MKSEIEFKPAKEGAEVFQGPEVELIIVDVTQEEMNGPAEPFFVLEGFKGSWSSKAVWIKSLDCYKIFVTHRLEGHDMILGTGHTKRQAMRRAFAEYERRGLGGVESWTGEMNVEVRP